ncbi:sugar ABC transporter ATP-binding protein [Nocardioides sp. LHD-245]|uniref:sugar ABC transporter ATP-binding protein n=1 Tax=Nocardioides sp. LHD-245 TaxID=3051387 RepID=UPI0027E0C4F9|nr:sugar ABC transporter ATP-binding protein [Nocardioides sp. LHD-245]
MHGETALPGLRIEDLHKSYDANRVLKGIDIVFGFGEVHALLGANGAGKSTLLGCLSGAVHPDRATITIGEERYEGFTPRRAFDAGIAIIYQHFQLIGPLSVADNIFLGRELRRPGGAVDRRRQEREASAVLGELGLDLDPRAPVEGLSVGAQQMVEIARAVRLEPRVLILDEPTAALGAHEVEALLALVRRLAARGIAVVYVTHLLGEVLEVADRATVLRDGLVHWTRPRAELDLADLVEGISPDAAIERGRDRTTVGDEVVLRLADVASGFTGPVDLEVRSGEVVGLFGLLGSGRTDLLESIAGVRPLRTGALELDHAPARLGSPRAAQRAGVALVPSDRKAQALFGSMSALENMLMPHLGRLAGRRTVRSRRREDRVFSRMVDTVDLVPPVAAQPADGFSGGNAQKIAVARWTCGLGRPRLLLLDEPTQGVDIGARHDIYALVRSWAAEAGAAVLFATSDPEEVVALADRVVVLVEGRVVHVGPADLAESALVALAQPAATERSVAS